MINVGLFIDRLDPGGTQRQFLEFLRGLDRSRFSPRVACFDARGAWATRVRELDVPLRVFPIAGFARPNTVRQLAAYRGWCRDSRLDVVHTWEIYSNIFGLPGAALAGVPVRFGSRRGLNPDRSPGLRYLQRLAYRAAHRIVANSQAGARQLIREGVTDVQIAVLYNGLDLDAFPERSLSSAPRRVLTVAGLRPIKGIDVLIEAAAEVVQHIPDARFTIVGDGPDREVLEAQARRLGLEPHVEFLGHRDEIPSLLAATDLFVLPSRSEAFPNALLEAMAAGLPAIATAVGGVLEVVEDDRTGVLVEPEKPAVLARALIGLMRDRDRAARLGRAARAAMRERYSLRSMVQRLEDLYTTAFAARTETRANVEPAA